MLSAYPLALLTARGSDDPERKHSDILPDFPELTAPSSSLYKPLVLEG